ncbi:hypothetical protein N7526_010888 [Penicillium atrosanguineum]|nr:hypothetical protein N7526_010888 [Penicillium atrosanguineum]
MALWACTGLFGEELGRSLEAVSPRILRQDGEEHSTQPDTRRLSDNETENESFTAIIRRLEHENQELRTQLARARRSRNKHDDTIKTGKRKPVDWQMTMGLLVSPREGSKAK